MRPELRALAATQAGLVTRAQAKDVGYTERELRTLTAVHGPWVVVRRGVYCERTLWDAATGYGERARLRDLAVHLTMRTPHLLSHDSAARALDIPMLNPRRELSHVTREGLGGTRTEHGVKHHLTRLGLLNTEVVDGVRVTGPARTALDLAREHGRDAGVVACDAVRQRGLSKAALESELLLMWCWPEVTQAKAAVDLSDPGAETPGESLLRLVLLELGIGEPDTQFPVQLRDSVAWVDIRIGCHLFEFDGKVKFLPLERGGVSDRPPHEIVWDERARHDAVCAEGLGMSRVCWDELFGSARKVLKTRLLEEYAATLARYGDVLPPHLAAEAARLRTASGRRPRWSPRRAG